MSFIPKSLLAASIVLSCTVACQRKAEAPASEGEISLKVGSAAPALEVSRWVKGDGPYKLEPGNVYVVEFWATWCGPCVDSIPHVTEMARTYKDKVTFVGVSVWEQGAGKELEDKVDSFVRDMGDKMDYFVARDTETNAMASNWLSAAGKDGIPCAFIVDGNGKIAWIGHPMASMEKEIDSVLAGAKS